MAIYRQLLRTVQYVIALIDSFVGRICWPQGEIHRATRTASRSHTMKEVAHGAKEHGVDTNSRGNAYGGPDLHMRPLEFVWSTLRSEKRSTENEVRGLLDIDGRDILS